MPIYSLATPHAAPNKLRPASLPLAPSKKVPKVTSTPTDIWTPIAPQGALTLRNGGGTTSAFSDCWVNTNSAFTVASKEVRNVTFAGVGSQFFWPPGASYPTTTVSDFLVENVSQSSPGGAGGTGEAGAWFGNPTIANRGIIRSCAWMGINIVGRSQGSTLSDILIEDCPVGLYFELATHDVTVTRVATRDIATTPVAGGSEPLGLLAGRSITMEYWHTFAEYGGLVGPYNITFQDCDIYCPPRDPRFLSGPTGFDPCAGAYIGPGCYGIRFQRCHFWGPGWAIYAPTVRFNNGPDVFIGSDCVFEQSGPNLSYHSLPMGP